MNKMRIGSCIVSLFMLQIFFSTAPPPYLSGRILPLNVSIVKHKTLSISLSLGMTTFTEVKKKIVEVDSEPHAHGELLASCYPRPQLSTHPFLALLAAVVAWLFCWLVWPWVTTPSSSPSQPDYEFASDGVTVSSFGQRAHAGPSTAKTPIHAWVVVLPWDLGVILLTRLVYHWLGIMQIQEKPLYYKETHIVISNI